MNGQEKFTREGKQVSLRITDHSILQFFDKDKIEVAILKFRQN